MKLDRRGFSLVEVMVAVALLAIGIVTALRTITHSSRLALYAGELRRAALLELEWLDPAHDTGHEEVLRAHAEAAAVGRFVALPKFRFDRDRSTPGFDAYDFQIQAQASRFGTAENVILRSFLVETNDKSEKKRRPDTR